ncbi:organic solute transport protein [Chloropicon primus]|uniref:Organic solute transport protein n=1 Tax=Chloropicon primus TaxID=1764295 RepID=A0A5B8MIY1_9CHLO|nr:organic solute transport protein [Chloropicon primus]UPQ99567.1 organic solute transport protein [Chloropicon primus]|eukprot:QDZ20359.1 organic solute transport protein [Chloropicon primus]
MSLYGVPFLLTNLGAQTIYVIDQRLRDQNIPITKAQRILGDICAVLFSESLWDQVITPQDLYTSESTRSVLEKIVHSSLIKLNVTSMNKLYDLTQMVFKHQLLTCSKPSMLWALTKKHIETIQDLVPNLIKLKDFNTSMGKFTAVAESLSASDWLALRQNLLEFFKGKRVKITLLMNTKFQSPNGSLASFNKQKGIDEVGGTVVKRFQVLKEGQKRTSTAQLNLPAYKKRMIVARDELICNIYDKDHYNPPTPSPMTSPRGIAPAPTPSPGTSPMTKAADPFGAATPRALLGDKLPRPALSVPKDQGLSTPTSSSNLDGGKELNSLAAMIGATRSKADIVAPSKLSIFADSIDVDEQSDGEDGKTADPMAAVKLVQDIVLETKLVSPRRNLEKVVEDLDLGGGSAGPGEDEGDDDLLDLMDAA